MIIDLQGDALAWYIAILLTAVSVLLLLILLTLRIAVVVIQTELDKLRRRIPRLPGSPAEPGEAAAPGGGGLGEMLGPIIGTLLGGR